MEGVQQGEEQGIAKTLYSLVKKGTISIEKAGAVENSGG